MWIACDLDDRCDSRFAFDAFRTTQHPATSRSACGQKWQNEYAAHIENQEPDEVEVNAGGANIAHNQHRYVGVVSPSLDESMTFLRGNRPIEHHRRDTVMFESLSNRCQLQVGLTSVPPTECITL